MQWTAHHSSRQPNEMESMHWAKMQNVFVCVYYLKWLMCNKTGTIHSVRPYALHNLWATFFVVVQFCCYTNAFHGVASHLIDAVCLFAGWCLVLCFYFLEARTRSAYARAILVMFTPKCIRIPSTMHIHSLYFYFFNRHQSCLPPFLFLIFVLCFLVIFIRHQLCEWKHEICLYCLCFCAYFFFLFASYIRALRMSIECIHTAWLCSHA